MTGRERILAALRLEQPDRVPHFELAYNESSIIGIARHFTDELPPMKSVADMTPEEMIMIFNALALIIDELDIDGLTARVLEQEEDLGDGCFKDSWGVIYKRNPFGLAFPMDGPIKSAADLRGFKPPKVDPDVDLMMLGMVRGRFGDRKAVIFSTHDCFRLSWGLRGGIEHLLIDYIDNPKLAHDLARMSTEYHKEMVAAAIEAGADGVVFECRNSWMSPTKKAAWLSNTATATSGRSSTGSWKSESTASIRFSRREAWICKKSSGTAATRCVCSATSTARSFCPTEPRRRSSRRSGRRSRTPRPAAGTS